jgi:predicted dehydrogenase
MGWVARGDAPALRWGILGTGWIAERFVHALRTSTTQQVVAVGSRTQASAERFAGAAGVLTAHGSPKALVADPGVDVVYVATPRQAHRSSALLAIAAGKHVLVEKPLGLDAAQAEEVAAAAATAGMFCMEALWTLFLPRFDVVRQVLEQGLPGDVRTVLADHGERFDPPHRILDPAMAGGSLLDLGCHLNTDLVALTRLRIDPASRAYAERRTAQGKTTKEIMRLLKRHLARELFPLLKADLHHAHQLNET